MGLATKAVRKALRLKFGFRDEGGGRHDRYAMYEGDRLVAYVDVSRSERELGDRLVGMMASQLGVSPRTLQGMVQCSVSQRDFQSAIDVT